MGAEPGVSRYLIGFNEARKLRSLYVSSLTPQRLINPPPHPEEGHKPVSKDGPRALILPPILRDEPVGSPQDEGLGGRGAEPGVSRSLIGFNEARKLRSLYVSSLTPQRLINPPPHPEEGHKPVSKDGPQAPNLRPIFRDEPFGSLRDEVPGRRRRMKAPPVFLPWPRPPCCPADPWLRS
ncbi:hypothetical protein FIV06_15970 [Labrenzia sp. THAF191b]|nr:hypothetical protein FIV06_15970 [Labrenzia sp. THAF191b]QFT05240.1 hypothetical protein FIV05_15965 [Labrenzia sp. THAF191a]QFT16784.1 hypothetical protein FIV03_15980 [Labrenzia sp. THAF187b]